MKIILESKVVGISYGKELTAPYRVVLTKRNGKWLFSPEQSFQNLDEEFEFNEFSGLPGWYLDTLLKEFPDEIAIDFGQQWNIRGTRKALLEAKQLIEEMDKNEL